MRLWTIHPKHLDARGLVALWREALLAQKVLQGRTRGYTHHPQLLRFKAVRDPAAALASYLAAVHEESVRRGYHFDRTKIGAARFRGRITETEGQLRYEWKHLKRKLAVRDTARHRASRTVPTFSIYDTKGEWVIEGHGVEPDIAVTDDPAELAKGIEPQLERAIDEVKKSRQAKPPLAPKKPAYPNRAPK